MDSKICVVGLGYIGLPTASVLAVHGFWVVGVDINDKVIETINSGNAHIHEPGLETMVKAATNSGHLVARKAIEPSDVFIIAVPTPINETNSADLTAVKSASEAIFPFLRVGNLVILESTVPPGTTKDQVIPILERSGLSAGIEFQVVHAPERVLPGNIMNELVQNDRILGGIDQSSSERASNIYNKFVSGNIFLTDVTTAEFVKLVENTYRDVNIGLANELAMISEKQKINVWEVIDLANRHPRVNVLQPGPGVGGHCIPVDPWFIIEVYPDKAKLIRKSRQINDQMTTFVCQSIFDLVKGFNAPAVAILGAAYKANVDDDRESPTYKIAEQLRSEGCLVRIHDPHVYPDTSLEEVVTGSDCLAIIVDHREYGDLDPEEMAKLLRNKNLFVARKFNAFDKWYQAGYIVKQLGNWDWESKPAYSHESIPKID